MIIRYIDQFMEPGMVVCDKKDYRKRLEALKRLGCRPVLTQTDRAKLDGVFKQNGKK